MKKQIANFEVDGIIYKINTVYPIYKVPGGKQTQVTTIHVFNCNSSLCNIAIWHTPNNEAVANKNRLLENFAIEPYTPCDISLGTYGITMSHHDQLYIKASCNNVNFILYGDES